MVVRNKRVNCFHSKQACFGREKECSEDYLFLFFLSVIFLFFPVCFLVSYSFSDFSHSQIGIKIAFFALTFFRMDIHEDKDKDESRFQIVVLIAFSWYGHRRVQGQGQE